ADANPVADPEGDASPPQLDLRRVELVQDEPTRLRVLMTLAAPPAADTSGLWLTRFQVLSTGVSGSAAYRTLYLGAATAPGKAPSFFGGTTTCAEPSCGAISFPATVPAIGSIDGNTITVDVALEGGFGAGFPLKGDLLYRNLVRGDVHRRRRRPAQRLGHDRRGSLPPQRAAPFGGRHHPLAAGQQPA